MIKKKFIVAVVPARGGSKGIKNKNLKKIKKKSLVELTSDFIDKTKVFDSKILNSDSKEILKLGKKLNFINISRPKYLSGDLISDYQLLEHSILMMNKLKIKSDYIVWISNNDFATYVFLIKHQ